MSFIGTLHLDCIAADPYSRFLYGIASANSEERLQVPEDTEYYIVLVRSNASPTSLSSLEWTVISSIRAKDFSYNYLTFTSVDCATNGRGDFTALFRSPYRALSPARLLPMGVRYNPDLDQWTAIQGTSVHGWSSDEFLHKSFYTYPESKEVFHLLTNTKGEQFTFGRLDSGSDLFLPESSLVRRERKFEQPTVDDDPMVSPYFDYTVQGFFSATDYYGPRLITYHRDTFYFNKAYMDEDICPFFPTSMTSTGRLGESCRFQPAPDHGLFDQGKRSIQYHIFGGDRNGATFFGGIYEIDNVLKIYTMENVENRTFIEHNLIRNDISTNLIVDRNFQVIGGLNKDEKLAQEPFVVALTSKGLYQFTIFGPTAGSMDGPYQVEIAAGFYSASQRVAIGMKPRETTMYENERQEAKRTITGLSIAAGLVVVLVLVTGGWFWWRRRRRRSRVREDKDGDREERDTESNSDDPVQSLTGKHEVHSIGLILESESTSSTSHINSQDMMTQQPAATTTTTNTTPTNPPPLNARLPSTTYQDHIGELELSSHPRPNIVISVGEP